jgi:hypothetical protein
MTARLLSGILFVLYTGFCGRSCPSSWDSLGHDVLVATTDWHEAGCGRSCMSCCWPNCTRPGR